MVAQETDLLGNARRRRNNTYVAVLCAQMVFSEGKHKPTTSTQR